MRANLRSIAQEADPKKALLDAVGDMDWYEVFHNLVLVATYIRPEKTQGGIILTDKALAEDRFQGKCGLVLKVGPLAFVDDSVAKFGGMKVAEGEWIMYRPSDGIELFVRDARNQREGVSCRLLEDTNIKARITDPSFIY